MAAKQRKKSHGTIQATIQDDLETDRLIVDRLRTGDGAAWTELMARYERRLLAFVESRIGRRGASEDIVQEAFVGFLTSLPNFDGSRPLESYLFSICAYKMADHLRREGRRPAVSLSTVADSNADSSTEWQPSSPDRDAASIASDDEQLALQQRALNDVRREQEERWKKRGDWTRLACIQLLFDCGMTNKGVANELRISEQQVANLKFEFIAMVRKMVQKRFGNALSS